jgi:hypothetical protein
VRLRTARGPTAARSSLTAGSSSGELVPAEKAETADELRVRLTVRKPGSDAGDVRTPAAAVAFAERARSPFAVAVCVVQTRRDHASRRCASQRRRHVQPAPIGHQDRGAGQRARRLGHLAPPALRAGLLAARACSCGAPAPARRTRARAFRRPRCRCSTAHTCRSSTCTTSGATYPWCGGGGRGAVSCALTEGALAQLCHISPPLATQLANESDAAGTRQAASASHPFRGHALRRAVVTAIMGLLREVWGDWLPEPCEVRTRVIPAPRFMHNSCAPVRCGSVGQRPGLCRRRCVLRGRQLRNGPAAARGAGCVGSARLHVLMPVNLTVRYAGRRRGRVGGPARLRRRGCGTATWLCQPCNGHW